jgi:hypothetical protein
MNWWWLAGVANARHRKYIYSSASNYANGIGLLEVERIGY